ncbi:ABC transporter ATP-binding protein [Aeromicrobium sp. NPDC092404]|uniref:ABC transporter ATP-binding protein n=1 Tax=Aeromicrobium sp. NPDC092404 TaxID=3154976 RepID=UPI00343197ED
MSGTEETSHRSVLGNTLDAARLIRRTAPREYVVLLVCTVVSGIGFVLLLVAGRDLIHDLTAGDRGREIGPLVPGLVGIAVGTVLTTLAAAVQSEVRWLMAHLVERQSVAAVVKAASTVPLAELESPDFQDHLKRTLRQAAQRPWELTQAVSQMAGAVTGGAVVAVVLATVEPWLVPAALLVGLPVLLAAGRNSSAMFAAVTAITPVNREREYLQDLLTGRDQAKEIRAFESGEHLRARFEQRYDDEIEGLRVVSRLRSRRLFIAGIGTTIITIATLALLVWLGVDGQISLADAAIGAVAVQQLTTRVRGIGGSISAVQESSLFLNDHAAFVARAARVRATETADAGPGSDEGAAVALHDVSFSYPGSAVPALRGVSLTLEAGRVTALVGANGSGKTTIAKLVCRLYEPDAGTITWGEAVTSSHGRPRVGVIFQDFLRYQLSAHDNVALGDVSRNDDRAGVVASARAARADHFLSRLARGFDTWLSPSFEGGTDLSVGQWQRVAMARALFRDAPVIVLDEPTAALDPVAEREMIDSTREVFADRAVLVISHRFANVVDADNIVVLAEGEIVERGTHDQLMARGGTYADLYTMQAATFGSGKP